MVFGLKPVSDALIWDMDQMSACVFFCNYSFLYIFATVKLASLLVLGK